MNAATAKDVRGGIFSLWESLKCPICLDLMTTPVSTKCDHQFCKFCIFKLLSNSKQNNATCPVCKAKVTKRSLQESPRFQRLVTGFQKIKVAYEHDTSTNLPVMSDRSKSEEQMKVTDEAAEHHQCMMSGSCLEAESDEHPVDDLPMSRSSTVAALNNYADLMGFGETSPLTTENEGLDSGLGDAPSTSQKKISTATHAVDTEMVEMTATPHKLGGSLLEEEPSLKQGDTQSQTVRSQSRISNQKEKILEQKQKSSVEKVAEWLMKVSNEGGLELENLNNVDADSDSCSFSSTIDVKTENCVPNQPKREKTKALEDQVFGAVYRRERKGTRTVPPPLDDCNKPDQTESEGVSENSGRKTGVKPAAADKKKKNCSAVLEEKLTVDDYGGKNAENGNNNGKEEAPRRRQRVRKKTNRMQSTVLQVDNDLQQQAESTSHILKTRNKKRSQNLRSDKSKSVSETKPLELISVQNEQTGPLAQPKSHDVQVQIENYPSSEDQELPSKRNTRSSKKLKAFVDAIWGGSRKARSNVDSKENNASEQPNETGGKSLEKETKQITGTSFVAVRNGCVCNEDPGGIETMDAGRIPQEKGKDSMSEAANSVREGSAACAPAMLNSASPSEVAISPTYRPTNSAQLDAAVYETPQAGDEEEEKEEERNDSELDTEQLLRSFKGTKRKSFHLGGGSSMKRSRSADETEAQHCDVLDGREKLSVRTPKASEGSGLDCENLSADVLSAQPVGNASLEKTQQEPMCVDSLPSHSPGLDTVGHKSASSPLPPNIQSKRCEADSLSPSVEPRVGESGLYFVSVAQGHQADISSPFPQTGGNRPTVSKRDKVEDRNSTRSGKLTLEQIANEESSLTPDGLDVTWGGNSQQKTKRCSGEEFSSLSPIESASRKRSRKLKSSSESSNSSGDDLPTLAQILGGSVRDEIPEQGAASTGFRQGAAEGVQEQLDQEHQSSQVSVDLFGTPEEGEAAAKDPGSSADSSQYSCDALVTQEKIEMQKELLRLEKLMAMVSEALHQKEGGPSREIPPMTEHSCRDTDSNQGLLPEDQETTSERAVLPEEQQQSSLRSSEVKGLQQVTGSKSGGPAEPTAPHPVHHRQSVKDAADSRNNSAPSESIQKNTPAGKRSRAKMVLVSSGLDSHQQIMMKRFAKQAGAQVASKVTAETTHVVMHTDDQLVCQRTLKYFLGIAGRKWVVSIQWISECFKQRILLDESPFEVRGDIVNGSNHQGPMRARTTDDRNLLMKDLRICFLGPFTDMTTDEMEWMVEHCGAIVVKDPLLLDVKQKSHQLVIFQAGTENWSTFNALSRSATLVTRGWLLDTVATYSLQECSKYKPEQWNQ